VVIEDLALKTLKGRTGVDSELIDEKLASLLKRRQSFCLPSGAVQRKHQLSARPLTQRMIGNEALEPGKHLHMMAKLELRLDLLLDDRQTELCKACGL
jgi:hypothetical protein